MRLCGAAWALQDVLAALEAAVHDEIGLVLTRATAFTCPLRSEYGTSETSTITRP